MNKKEIKQLMKDKIKKDTIKIGSNITHERSDNMAFKNGTLINKKAVNNLTNKQIDEVLNILSKI